MKIKKGDKVIVNSGKDKGKAGTVTAVIPALDKVLIDGINVVKRAYKPSPTHPKGGIISEAKPLHVSKVNLVHPKDDKRGSRVGFELDSKGVKQRVYRQAKNEVVKDAK